MRRRTVVELGVLLGVAGAARDADAGTCKGVVVVVDNDLADSGYAEVHPENFQTHDVDACAGTYRYLSKYVGDGSTDGRVTWQPTIAVAGAYRVTTSFRASSNRSDDADYLLVGDDGQQQAVSVDQRGDGCTRVELGELWCNPGGSCRLELDGTDDLQSEAADETTFELVECEPPAPSGCDPLRDAGFEVCGEGPGRCEGVFMGGEGCVAYCATVGMTCVARFGGEPGCAKEAEAIPCDAINDHASDYCVCEGEPPPSTTGADTTDASSDGPAAASSSSTDGGSTTSSSGGADPGDPGSGGGTTPWPGAGDPGGSSCACTSSARPDVAAVAWLCSSLLLHQRRRRRGLRGHRRGPWLAGLPLAAVTCT